MGIDDAIRKAKGEPLRCPNDGTRLVELERSGILIDACPECRGIWLDRGELDRLLERERQVSRGTVDDDEDFFAEMEGRRKQKERSRPAPTAEYDDEDDHGDRRSGKKRRKRGMFEDLFDVFGD